MQPLPEPPCAGYARVQRGGTPGCVRVVFVHRLRPSGDPAGEGPGEGGREARGQGRHRVAQQDRVDGPGVRMRDPGRVHGAAVRHPNGGGPGVRGEGLGHQHSPVFPRPPAQGSVARRGRVRLRRQA